MHYLVKGAHQTCKESQSGRENVSLCKVTTLGLDVEELNSVKKGERDKLI